MIKKLRILWIVMRYWEVLQKASIIINDTKSVEGQLLSQDLTTEEIDGCLDLESIHRIFIQSPAVIKKELQHLEKVILKKK